MNHDIIRSFRTQIDQIDKSIIELLKKRMELAYKIGLEKGKNGQVVTVPEREKEILESLNNVSSPYMSSEDFKTLFSHIILFGRKAGEKGAQAVTNEGEKI